LDFRTYDCGVKDQCKTLTARLKGSGMRWDSDNAEAIMALEALTQSGQWDAYWGSQLRPTS
jgi:hypothetical protein